MKSKTFSKPVSILIALSTFVVVIAMMVFVAAPLQKEYEMLGLLITELVFLFLSVALCFAFCQNPKEMFPVKKPPVKNIFGTVVMWIGMYIAVITVTLVEGCFFPEVLTDTTTALSDFFGNTPAWVNVAIVALSPAICEEALHRGFILHFIKRLENKWLIIIIMGIIFGIFHMNPVRFLPTAILGGAITYIAIKTDNIVLCALFHLINNIPSAIITSTGVPETSVELSPTSPIPYSMASGVYLIISCIVPWLILAASALLSHKGEKTEHLVAKLVICSVISILLIVVGSVVITMSIANMEI